MNYKLYWELTNEGDARLLRAFGETPEPAFPGRDRGKSDYGDRGLLLCGAGASPGRMPVQLCAGGAGSRRRTGDSAGRGDAAEPETDGAPETDDALAELAGHT